MSTQPTRVYKLATPTNTSSLSAVPTLYSTPKTIWFRICENRNQFETKCIDVRDNLTYDQFKREISEQLLLTVIPKEFSLSVFDIEQNSWKMIDERNFSDKYGSLKLPNNSVLSIEKLEHERSTNERDELSLMLCRQPKCTTDRIDLTIKSSATLGQLKEQAQKMVTNQETHNLYLRSKVEWSIFGKTLDGQSLTDLGFTTNSIISFGTKYDPFPGVCGLTNLGNTCFMNSALQCLSNVPQLTEKILSFDEKMNAPVIRAYVNLIKTIWSGEYTDTTPSSLLINIREDLPRFTKYRQHDAQEFMNYFLLLIHQELTDENTLITRLFHGTIKSSIKCLDCNSTEANEETISFLPLPMDSDTHRYDILYLEKYGEQRLLPVRTDARKVDALIESFIQQHCPKLSPIQIKPVKIMDNCIVDEYSAVTYISDGIKSGLGFVEVPEKTNDQKYLKLEFIDQKTDKPFRPPLFLVGPFRGCRYSDIIQQIDQIRDYLCSTTNVPFSVPQLYRINSNREYLNLSAGKSMNQLLFCTDELVVEMDSQYAEVYRNRYNIENNPRETSLNMLLADFFREELLNGDYYCSKCQNLRKAKQKADLTLPLPSVLIIQLKRFPYDVYSTAKIDTFINFPLKNLDLSEYIASDDLKNGKMLALYDLVAVSNHTGTLTCGHYTTYAKNYQNQKWYSFNDILTREIDDELDIVTRNAYILVYVRQTVP